MLKIDNKNIELTKEEIYVRLFTLNKVEGHFLGIKLEFINKDTKEGGYINLDVGFNLSNDIKVFTNKDYQGIPYDKEPYIYFEVFDTEKFYDTEIDEPINIKIGNIIDNKVNVSFEIKHKLINIKYKGQPLIVEITKK